jgi:hypothetical protein
VLYADIVAFHTQKIGSAPIDLQDCAGYDEAWGSGQARFAVSDGATSAYNSLAWACLLVQGFVDGNHPGALPDPHDAAALRNFVAHAQKAWADQPAPDDIFAAERFRREGSHATFVGCLVYGLADASPRWRAVTIGDSVLFHTRGGQLVDMLPRMAAEDFSSRTDLISTRPADLDADIAPAQRGEGGIEPGDFIFGATDAMAHWIISAATGPVWNALATINHHQFLDLVHAARAAGEMHNDDTSLVRVSFTTRPPLPEAR